MTLQVPFEGFAAAAARVLGAKEAYVTRHAAGALVTASNATSRTIVAALAGLSPDAAKAVLESRGLKVYEGVWAAEGLTDLGDDCMAEAHVAAVAYTSGEGRPGLWIDAFDAVPTPAQVLRGMYEEFRDTGEAAEVSFEEFVRLANANVVVVTPAQLRGYLHEKAARQSSSSG